MWERVSQFVEKKNPEKVATGRASDLFNDTCLTHFRNILRGRKKQTSLDMLERINGNSIVLYGEICFEIRVIQDTSKVAERIKLNWRGVDFRNWFNHGDKHHHHHIGFLDVDKDVQVAGEQLIEEILKENIDVGVSVHPKALLKEMGRHDITFTADNAKDHYGGRKFRVHHDSYERNSRYEFGVRFGSVEDINL
ncbi:hypothetical protein LAZ67_10002174 [Cordylochernes scorpioides]|uniref:Uncharacterized protein n=1 Tax=Cordylochernes scorpioides TaxID=51811 RepID=A0ABY6L0A5_9ARAC|nr:hypothetical protein LAZ67_10002174 [Cordylochernes scorpioides]